MQYLIPAFHEFHTKTNYILEIYVKIVFNVLPLPVDKVTMWSYGTPFLSYGDSLSFFLWKFSYPKIAGSNNYEQNITLRQEK